jgi:alkylhydroperoxidase family enzyme
MKDKSQNHIQEKKAFIVPPKKINIFLKMGILISKKITGKDLLVPKLLAWAPKVAVSSGILESLVSHGKKDLNPRLLKLVRIQTSLSVSCPFCIDMNGFGYKEDGITDAEIDVLKGRKSTDEVTTFSGKELIVLDYVKHLCASPISMPVEVSNSLIQNYTEREIVILASTVAQVNYWARLIQGLGVPPEGFMDHCEL